MRFTSDFVNKHSTAGKFIVGELSESIIANAKRVESITCVRESEIEDIV